MARLGGVILMLLGAALTVAAWSLGLALLGRPVPDLQGLVQLKPYLAQIATGSPVPPGQDFTALAGVGVGRIALAGMAMGVVIAFGGLVQLLFGRNPVSLLIVVAGIIGFAVTAALA